MGTGGAPGVEGTMLVPAPICSVPPSGSGMLSSCCAFGGAVAGHVPGTYCGGTCGAFGGAAAGHVSSAYCGGTCGGACGGAWGDVVGIV
jgi:hypothetical protein